MPWQAVIAGHRIVRHTRGWRRIGAALLLGLALTVAACGASTAGSAQPTPTSTQASGTTPTSTPTPQLCTEWRVVASPNVTGTGYWVNELYAVSALSPTAAWAVGVGNQELSAPRSLIEQWDGTKWRIIPNSGGDVLKGVAANSPRDVWAVGGQLPIDAEDYQPHNPLIMHWDGTRWSNVPSPSTGGHAELVGIVALAANDVWAVGAVGKGTASGSPARIQPLIEHWDGTAWNIVSSPAPNGGRLRAVATIPGTRQLWAVGYTSSGTDTIHNQALIERWNGTAWQIVPGPSRPLNATGVDLQSVVALSANDAWVVGTSYSSGSQNLIAHWGGTEWRLAYRPRVGAPLAGVAAAGPHDVRAVGWIGVLGELDAFQHVHIEQWDGAIWHIVASPDPGATSGGSQLNGITSDGVGKYWAVGSYYKEGLQTLTLRCS